MKVLTAPNDIRMPRYVARLLVVASSDTVANVAQRLTSLGCEVVTVVDPKRLREHTQRRWDLVLLLGQLEAVPSEVIAAQLSRSGCADLICTLAPEQINNPRVERMLQGLVSRSMDRALCENADVASLETAPHFELDERERSLAGVEMEPLVAGELRLLRFLGKHPKLWHSTLELSQRVYARQDTAGRQLVWKYASTLRRKLEATDLPLIEVCRRRGYRCLAFIAQAPARLSS